MEKQTVVCETAALMVDVANKVGILDTLNEVFGVTDDHKASGLYLTIPIPESVLSIDVTRQDFPQRLLNALNNWGERVHDNTVRGAFPLITADIETREKLGGLGKTSLTTLKTWVIERAWMQMSERQKMEFCENLLELNTYYFGGARSVE